MNRNSYRLKNGARVAVVGGGPAGCFFALYLMQYGRERHILPDVTIFEARNVFGPGPKACKGCAGILSTSLLRSLGELGLAVPEEIIQRRIDGYTIQSPYTSITMRNPEQGAEVISVFRGCGPRLCDSQRPVGFDGWLLMETQKRGARIEYGTVSAVRTGRNPQVETAGELKEFDLIVLATGVNGSPFAVEGVQYIPPKTRTMAQDELRIDAAATVDTAHALLIPGSGLIAGCFVPKGEFLNVSILNKSDQPMSVAEFLQNDIVRTLLPDSYQRMCGCLPRVPVSPAQNYYADGFVAVGDAAVSRLYKDGIGSALRTAREAARTAMEQGISKRSFRRHYRPFCRSVDRDNRWGKFLFWLNDRVKESRTFLLAQHRLIGDEQTSARELKPFTIAVWGIFTGSCSYRSIARMTLAPASLYRLGLAFLRESSREIFNRNSSHRKLLIRARKVLILGSGFGGTYVLRNLVPALNRNENVETTMVSDENFFLFSPLLHEAALGRIETRHIAYPVRRLHWRDRFRFVHSTVHRIDLAGRTVTTGSGKFEFDYLVLALGSVTQLVEAAHENRNMFTLKSLHDSMLIRNHIIQRFEHALVETDPLRRRELLTFVVAGGGYKGIQLITELTDFIEDTLLRLYRPIVRDDVRVILVEAEARIVADLHASFGAYIMRRLKAMKIEVRSGSRITSVGENYVEINGAEKVPAGTVIWVAGVVANPRISELEVEKDSIGRVIVDERLTVPGYRGVYAVGDCAHFKDPGSGKPIPARAHIAVRQARAVARNILADIRGGEGKPYRYHRIPQMVSLGSFRAVVKWRRLRLYGLPARIAWMAAYLFLITGTYNRIRITMDWLLSFVFGRDTTHLDLADLQRRERPFR
ncbi:MAG: FAD-dependent oxidoreductase [Acidobacteria bacterium]|nr:FAD-dependent oxidoreductase [Acidobacteriota bacterium]